LSDTRKSNLSSRAAAGIRLIRHSGRMALSSVSPADRRHRAAIKREIEEARTRLAAMRDGRDVCWAEEDAANPLVTIRIPCFDRGSIVVRAITSALAQTYTNIEVLVVGDGATPETVAAVQSVHDPRLRFVNIPRTSYPTDPKRHWMVVGHGGMNYALDAAKGAWITPLDDDDEYTPDHVEVLLREVLERRLEFVYGQTLVIAPDGATGIVGRWPPSQGAFTNGALLYSTKLRFLKYDPESWRERLPADWTLWRRMIAAGVKMGYVEHIVYRYYPAKHVPL
jgi:glycosyltransferase involved in cell wall biosynthesis